MRNEFKRRNKWTPEEIEILKKEFPLTGTRLLVAKLPRSANAIRMKASNLGIKMLPEKKWPGLDPQIIQNLTESQKAYFAGLFDGEGKVQAVRFRKTSPHFPSFKNIQVSILNTNRAIIEKLRELFGGSFCHIEKSKMKWKDGSKRKDVFKWSMGDKRAIQFLEIIFPYLIIKRQEAEVAFKFQSTVQYFPKWGVTKEVIEKRNKYAKELKALKRQ